MKLSEAILKTYEQKVSETVKEIVLHLDQHRSASLADLPSVLHTDYTRTCIAIGWLVRSGIIWLSEQNGWVQARLIHESPEGNRASVS